MQAVIVGRGGPGVENALLKAGLPSQVAPDGDAAREALGTPSDIRLVVLDGEVDPAFVTWLRGQPHLFALPVIALLPAVAEAPFLEAVRSGCDDVVPRHDAAGLADRARAVARHDPALRPGTSGQVLVCGTSLDRRLLLGRLIRMAGFEVAFTVGTADVPPGPFRFAVVAMRPGAADALSTVTALRSAQPDLAIVLSTAPEDGAGLQRLLNLPAIALTTEAAPVHDVLYLANEVLRARLPEVRRSPRLLADLLCAFRPEGERLPAWAITHTVSGGGFYVRTLHAPAAGTRIWIELCPDGATRVVHLRGDVVWSRAFGEPVGVYSPPGFGVALDLRASPLADRRLFAAAYRKRLKKKR